MSPGIHRTLARLEAQAPGEVEKNLEASPSSPSCFKIEGQTREACRAGVFVSSSYLKGSVN
jgi:hypothetical protein